MKWIESLFVYIRTIFVFCSSKFKLMITRWRMFAGKTIGTGDLFEFETFTIYKSYKQKCRFHNWLSNAMCIDNNNKYTVVRSERSKICRRHAHTHDKLLLPFTSMIHIKLTMWMIVEKLSKWWETIHYTPAILFCTTRIHHTNTTHTNFRAHTELRIVYVYNMPRACVCVYYISYTCFVCYTVRCVRVCFCFWNFIRRSILYKNTE